MANSSLVGALRVHLGLDSAQFTEGLTKAKAGLGDWAKTAKVATAAVVATMVTAAGAVGVAIKGMIDRADEMSKMSQQIGIPIEELSRLKYAAELSDVSLEQLSKGVKRLSAAMLDIAQGGTGPAARAFAMLGVNAQDANGALRPASQVIADLSTKFAAMGDGATKTALAMNIFGKSGADLIPLLNSGGEGLREMYAEAEELGLVLDERTGKAAEAFNDNLTRLQAVQSGIVNKIGAEMLPALESMTGALVDVTKNSELLSAIGSALSWTLKAVASVAAATGAVFAGLAVEIKGAYDMMRFFLKGDFIGGTSEWQAARRESDAIRKGADDFYKQLWSAPPAAKAAGKAITSAGMAIENYSKTARKASKETDRLTDAQKEEAREAERQKQEGARLTESLRTAEETHADELERINALYDAGRISLETYLRAVKKADDVLGDAREARNRDALATDDFGIGAMLAELDKADAAKKKAADDLAAQTESDLKNATFDGIAGGLYAAADGDLGEYLANALKRNLIEGLASSLTEAISGQGGGKWLKAIGSFFAGFPGFATGGSFKVGGSGGIDSQFVGMRLTPGEMVDVRKPGQERASGGTNIFDMRGAVVTEKLLRDVEAKVQAGEARAVSRSTAIAKRSLPAAQDSQRRLGTV